MYKSLSYSLNDHCSCNISIVCYKSHIIIYIESVIVYKSSINSINLFISFLVITSICVCLSASHFSRRSSSLGIGII